MISNFFYTKVAEHVCTHTFSGMCNCHWNDRKTRKEVSFGKPKLVYPCS